MAMVEHYCTRCGRQVFNNSELPRDCPDCGGHMNKAYDEPAPC